VLSEDAIVLVVATGLDVDESPEAVSSAEPAKKLITIMTKIAPPPMIVTFCHVLVRDHQLPCF
jgi:hypothetical protein